MKACSKCGVEKPETGFYRDSQKRDGLSSACKPCKDVQGKRWTQQNRAKSNAVKARWQKRNPAKMNAAVKRWQAANPAKVRASYKKWATANPEKVGLWRKQNPELSREAVKRSYRKHREATLARQRAARAANPERVAEIQRRSYERRYDKIIRKNEARRARLAGLPAELTATEWAETLETFNRCCAYCLAPLGRVTKDHFRPIARGGGHTVDNVVPSCQSCNSRKGDDLIFDWVRRGVGVCPPQA